MIKSISFEGINDQGQHQWESARRKSNSNKDSIGDGGNTDYRSELWKMADALRGAMDAAEYKHVVLGLIFLKYISDAFEEANGQLE